MSPLNFSFSPKEAMWVSPVSFSSTESCCAYLREPLQETRCLLSNGFCIQLVRLAFLHTSVLEKICEYFWKDIANPGTPFRLYPLLWVVRLCSLRPFKICLRVVEVNLKVRKSIYGSSKTFRGFKKGCASTFKHLMKRSARGPFVGLQEGPKTVCGIKNELVVIKLRYVAPQKENQLEEGKGTNLSEKSQEKILVEKTNLISRSQ